MEEGSRSMGGVGANGVMWHHLRCGAAGDWKSPLRLLTGLNSPLRLLTGLEIASRSAHPAPEITAMANVVVGTLVFRRLARGAPSGGTRAGHRPMHQRWSLSFDARTCIVKPPSEV